MKLNKLIKKESVKALIIGIITALILSAIMVPAFKFGIAPMPKPPGLAFAEMLVGRQLPLAVGLLFHVGYLLFWSLVYVVLFKDDLSFLNALLLSLFLWVVILVGFFPLLGWGFLGLAIGPKMIPGSLVPHILFAVVLWGLCRAGFRKTA